MIYPTPAMQAHASAYLAELVRNKEDDDWSGYSAFVIQRFDGLCGYRYRVLANGFVQVGVYETFDNAMKVKAKLGAAR